jgi:hypothetical protein
MNYQMLCAFASLRDKIFAALIKNQFWLSIFYLSMNYQMLCAFA